MTDLWNSTGKSVSDSDWRDHGENGEAFSRGLKRHDPFTVTPSRQQRGGFDLSHRTITDAEKRGARISCKRFAVANGGLAVADELIAMLGAQR